MSEQKPPIKELTYHMAELVIRLIETEKKFEEQERMTNEWYQNWKNENARANELEAQLKEMELKLNNETESHLRFKQQFMGYIKKHEKGTQENGDQN